MSKARAPIEAVEVFQMVNRINDASQAAAGKEHGTHVAGEYDAGEKSADTSHELAKARTRMAQISLGLLCLLLLTSTFCFGKQQKHSLMGWAENTPCNDGSLGPCADVYPLLNEANQPIQWNAPTFSGFLWTGSWDGLKHKDVCDGARTCYWYDGRGSWKFDLTGWAACKNTCTYVATGDLILTTVPLPDGSTTTQLSAVLSGNFVDEFGVSTANLMAYYSSYTAPTKEVGWPTQTLAQGGITIVLADN